MALSLSEFLQLLVQQSKSNTELPEITEFVGGTYNFVVKRENESAQRIQENNMPFVGKDADGNVIITATLNVGSGNTTSGIYSAAIGQGNTASGDQSFVQGFASQATSNRSVAIGNSCESMVERLDLQNLCGHPQCLYETQPSRNFQLPW